MGSLAIVFGGNSYEHEISIVSAIVLKDVIKKNLVFIFLDSSREFYLIDRENMKSSYFSSLDYKKSPKLSLKQGGFFKKTLFSEAKVEFNRALNLIHGSDGEDGKLASLFEFYSLNYISPRVEASVMSFSKHLTKLYAKEVGVEVLDYQILTTENRELKMDFPLIIKPLKLGSSIGIAVAKTEDEFEYGLDVAFEFDSAVIVEPFYENVREFNLAGTKSKDGFIFSNIEEPQKRGEFLDFDKKYMDFARDSSEKQSFDSSLTTELQESFEKIYSTLFEGSIIRCDFFYIDNRVYLNEINPIPGSMANYLFDDFNSVLDSVYLPETREIDVDYKYINSIQSIKGK
jgi:D-alanine-D-alanine ligase